MSLNVGGSQNVSAGKSSGRVIDRRQFLAGLGFTGLSVIIGGSGVKDIVQEITHPPQTREEFERCLKLKYRKNQPLTKEQETELSVLEKKQKEHEDIYYGRGASAGLRVFTGIAMALVGGALATAPPESGDLGETIVAVPES